MSDKIELDFIIFCEKRTGSHLLSTLLDNHPDITCQFRELAMQHRKIITPKAGKIRGGIIHYQEIERAMEYIKFKKVIHLIRNLEDVFNSYIATFYTRESIGHYTRDDLIPEKPELGLEKQKRRKIIKELSTRRLASFSMLVGYPTLLVSYGMLSEGKDVSSLDNSTSRSILRFLGADIIPLETRLRKGISSYDS